MAGYPTPIGDSWGPLIARIVEAEYRLSQLEKPTGTSVNSLVAQVQQTLANIDAEVQASIEANSYTKAEIDSKVANPPSISTGGNVTTSATVTGSAGITSIGAYNHDITYTRRTAWWGNDGRGGYASSSIEKKVLVEAELPDPLVILEICDTFYHYKAELDKRDNPENPEYDPDYHVAMEWGSIAEWLHELGLWMVVIYEDHVKPIGVHYEMLGLLAIRAAKHIWAEHLLLREDVTQIKTHLGI